MTKRSNGARKRYNLVLSQGLYDELQRIAGEKSTSIKGVLQRFIEIGLIVERVSKAPNAEIVIRDGDKERTIHFV
jgi:hypothetical protein